jgi:leucyl-tRNA synthetase
MKTYNPWEIEARWRERWAEDYVYRTPVPDEGQATFYCLDFFPYPSGSGLSVGHGRNYVPTDVIARYHRMRGAAVLHPMGWDAFGLPAENEAMDKGLHPAESTARYAANYRHQLSLLGCSYDWEREFSSANPAYYRWNQAFFLLLYKRGLAYRAAAPVNWCAHCQTVLADEEIEDGTCWRCHQPVVRRTLSQWYIRTTAYADELYAELENLDWPDHILAMQRHWIGRSEGLDIALPVVGHDHPIHVFTTRPDTYFGVTFVILAPEHPRVASVTTPEQRETVRAYIQKAKQRSDLERHTREPDGVATGAEAILPQVNRRVPIFVADYVLAEHGTGAIMGVPAHDTRDFAFAQRYDLPVKIVILSKAEETVIAPAEGSEDTLAAPYTEAGTLVNSGHFNGLNAIQAQKAIADWMTKRGIGERVTHYRLHDWLVSRQRYWGTPIPIVHCPACGEVPVSEEDLPIVLPPLPDYQPRGDGRSPLANVPDFVQTTCPRCGSPAERETDTMTGFVCSSWYYMRFVDPHNDTQPFDPQKVAQWLPVDLYVGGAEHAVGHLMYSRFWTKVLADEGIVNFREPFPVLRSQGVLHVRDPQTGHIERMSKSRGNVVVPEDVIAHYGADVTRLHLLFMGPFEANVVWEVEEDDITPQHIAGVRRFLQRVWRLAAPQSPTPSCSKSPSRERCQADADADENLERAQHRTVQEVTEQIEILHFNKAISALMTFTNAIEAYRREHGDTPAFNKARETLLHLLAPFAPFITEELWAYLGGTPSIHQRPWPTWDPAKVQMDKVEIAVQVNGKVRDRIVIANDADEATIRTQALDAPGVQQAVNGNAIKRVIVVPGQIVNVVV